MPSKTIGILQHTQGRADGAKRQPSRTRLRQTRVFWSSLLLLTSIFVCSIRPSKAHAATQQKRLPNGLTLVVQVKPTAQQTTLAVSYLAGERFDPAGKQGLSRLVERLMFAGSASVDDGGHRRAIATVAGRSWVERTPDVVTFVNRVPPRQLPLAVWLEADRMAQLRLQPPAVVRAKQALVAARKRATRGVASLLTRPLAALALQGRAGPVSRPLANVDSSTRADASRFHRVAYAPGRAVVTVVGPVSAAETWVLLERYFGLVKRPGKRPPAPQQAFYQTSRRTSSLRAARAQLGGYGVSWAVPVAARAASEVAGELLAGGRASWLHAAVVRRDANALSVGYRVSRWRGASLLRVWLELPRGSDAAAVMSKVSSRVLALRQATAAQVQLAKQKVVTRWQGRLQRDAQLAHLLGVHQLVAGTADALFQHLTAIGKIDRSDLRKLAAHWLTPLRQCTVELDPVPVMVPAKKSKTHASAKTAGGAARAVGKAKPRRQRARKSRGATKLRRRRGPKTRRPKSKTRRRRGSKARRPKPKSKARRPKPKRKTRRPKARPTSVRPKPKKTARPAAKEKP